MASMDRTFGAFYIGVLVATFFQGVLSIQAYNYFENFPKDPVRTKILVGIVWALDLAHLVLISHAGYHYFITNWGNVQSLTYSTRGLNLHPALVGIATACCQIFFLRRIWVLSKRNIPLIAVLSLGCLATACLDIIMSGQIMGDLRFTRFADFTPEIVAVFVIGAVTDIAMSALMCFYLQRERSGFQRTDSLITRIGHYSVATGAATSVLAVACLITFLTGQDNFIFFAMHFSLGRMYTNALLATLNGRRSLREALQLSGPIQHANQIHVSEGEGRRVYRQNNPTAIEMKVQTVTRTDSITEHDVKARGLSDNSRGRFDQDV